MVLRLLLWYLMHSLGLGWASPASIRGGIWSLRPAIRTNRPLTVLVGRLVRVLCSLAPLRMLDEVLGNLEFLLRRSPLDVGGVLWGLSHGGGHALTGGIGGVSRLVHRLSPRHVCRRGCKVR